MRQLAVAAALFAILVLGFAPTASAAPLFEEPTALSVNLSHTDIAAGDSVVLRFMGIGAIGASYVRAVSDAAHKLDGSIAPIPAPAAIWLLMAGLGGLGIFRRRRENALPSLRHGAEIEPAGVALRCGSVDLSTRAVHVGWRFAPFVRLRALHMAFVGDCSRYQAFANGLSSPVRPCGGAGNLYAATAERAPPVRTFWGDFLGSFSFGLKRLGVLFFEWLGQGIGLAALLFASDASDRELVLARLPYSAAPDHQIGSNAHAALGSRWYACGKWRPRVC
jgi:hypothetical protein